MVVPLCDFSTVQEEIPGAWWLDYQAEAVRLGSVRDPFQKESGK